METQLFAPNVIITLGVIAAAALGFAVSTIINNAQKIEDQGKSRMREALLNADIERLEGEIRRLKSGK